MIAPPSKRQVHEAVWAWLRLAEREYRLAQWAVREGADGGPERYHAARRDLDLAFQVSTQLLTWATGRLPSA